MRIQIDLLGDVAPMLISQSALSRMAGKIDFASFQLALPSGLTIQLVGSPSGHVLLPDAPINEPRTEAITINKAMAFPAFQTEPTPHRILTDV